MLTSACEYRASTRRVSIYNSLGAGRTVLDPLDPSSVKPKVLVYVCGLTPQERSHLGHGLMAMRFDMIRRYLMYRRLNVVFVQNVTDIDDKIIAKVLSQGIDAGVMTRQYTDEFYELLGQLHVLPVDRLTRVTEFIPQIISFIERLIERGFAYATQDGNVYFDVAKSADYGKLSNQNVAKLFESVRKEGERDKRSALDFALWKSDASTPLSSQSPWGIGRPGWHIECSAMIYEALGQSIDIHGGSLDLKFPHHENEIAQSEAHSGCAFASVWMHGGLMTVDGQKMSKSLNNFLLLADALKRYGAAPIRFAVARAHYRAAIDLTNAWLREPLNSLLDFHRLFARVPTERCVLDQECLGDPFIKNLVEQFETAMDSDFNTPEAVVALEKARAAIVDDIEKQKLTSDQAMPEMISKRVAVLRELGTILGVFFESLEEVENEGLRLVAHSLGVQELTPDEICAAMRERAEVRAQRDFKRSDEIRAQLATRGVELLDSKAGSTWRFV